MDQLVHAPHELQAYQRPFTAVEIRAQVNLIQEVMKAVMRQDTHYGVIPGCKKPSLWKPGAEVLFTTFHIFVDPHVEDLSTQDEARFRVTAQAKSGAGQSLGSAVGEASSDEEKYKWREMVCSEEYEETPETQRRKKWKNGRNGPYVVFQLRTNIADCRNTVLKMAAKRAYVALALQVTAASDIFTQDIEDLPEDIQESAVNGDAEPTATSLPTELKRREPVPQPAPAPAPTAPVQQQVIPPRPPQPVSAPRPQVQTPKLPPARTISDAQARRFYAIFMQAGRSKEEVRAYLQEVCGITDSRQMPADKYEAACKWAQGEEEF